MESLMVGKALTGLSLLEHIRQAAQEVSSAGGTRIVRLVQDFVALPFTAGKSVFRDAREAAGDDKPTLVRLSEAHAIFTSVSLAGVKAEAYSGMGWLPAVKAARESLKAAGVTVAGNPRLTDLQREEQRAKRDRAEVAQAAVEAIVARGEEPTPEAIATEMAEQRQKLDTTRQDKAFPDAVIELAKALDSAKAALTTLRHHADRDSAAWQTLPFHVKLLVSGIFDGADDLTACAVEIATVREQAKEQRAHEKAEAALVKAQKMLKERFEREELKVAA